MSTAVRAFLRSGWLGASTWQGWCGSRGGRLLATGYLISVRSAPPVAGPTPRCQDLCTCRGAVRFGEKGSSIASSPEDLRLERLAHLVAVACNTELLQALLSVLDGWQGHLRVQVCMPASAPWVGIAIARGEQVSGAFGLPTTVSILVQGAHGEVCVPVDGRRAPWMWRRSGGHSGA